MKLKNPFNNPEVDFKTVTNITQSIRFKAMASVVKKGIPQDNEERYCLIKLLDGCDKTALAVKKLEGDLVLTDAQKDLYNTVSVVLNSIDKNPFMCKSNVTIEATVPSYDFIEGEDLIGIDRGAEDTLENGD